MQSKYLGVYRNNYAPTKEEFPYRVALKRYVNSKAEYINIGYTRTEDSAGYLYNIYALATFGKGAIINDIEFVDSIEDELNSLIESFDGFAQTVEKAIHVLENHGDEVKLHTPEEIPNNTVNLARFKEAMPKS